MTIVAAWISAETGVGPSIASGNHVCSGTCADFAAAPTKSPTQTAIKTPTGSVPAFAKMSANAIEPVAAYSAKTANMIPTSPKTLITKAFLAAATALGL